MIQQLNRYRLSVSAVSLLLLLTATFGWAGGAGTSSGDFLSLGAGSRLAGLGGGGIALIDDASSLYWNPGAMTRVNHQSAVLMHASYLQSSAFSQGYYVRDLDGAGTVGAGLTYFSYGDMDRTDDSGQPDGSFTPNDLTATVGYAREFGPISAGGGVKYVKSTIVDSASTLAFDLGVLSKPLLNDKLRLAASVTQLGGKIKFDKESEDLPQEYRFGIDYLVMPKLHAVVDLALPKAGDTYIAGGLEYAQPLANDWRCSGRAGYSTKSAGDVSGLTGVTFGLGVARKSLGFDYALVPQGDLGMTHWIALVYRD